MNVNVIIKWLEDFWKGDSIQLFHTFLCNSQNYHTLGSVDDPMALLHEAEGNSA